MAIRKAEKLQAKLRLALVGPTGSGKTFTALAMAEVLGSKVGVLDTERNSACLYSDSFTFDVEAEMASYNPAAYIDKINEFAAAGYDVLVIDSLSHAWNGRDGALEMVDKAAARAGNGNKFAGWRDVTPLHNRMVDAILNYPGHVIVTMRSKMEYVQEKDDRGRTTIRKVGMQPVQRDGMEYEFTVVGDMDQDHKLIVTKSRCAAIADGVYMKPGKDIAEVLLAWLNSGVAPTPPTATPDAAEQAVIKLEELLLTREFTAQEIAAVKTDIAKAKRLRAVVDLPANAWTNVYKAVGDGYFDKFHNVNGAPVGAGSK